MGVSLIRSSLSTTTVCVYILGTSETSGCKIFDKIYETSEDDDGLEWRRAKLGRGLIGVLRTAYIWGYAKAPRTMKLTLVS